MKQENSPTLIPGAGIFIYIYIFQNKMTWKYTINDKKGITMYPVDQEETDSLYAI